MVFFSSGLWPAGFSLCIVAVMLVMFWQERFPSEVIALSGAALFLVTGILPYETALQASRTSQRFVFDFGAHSMMRTESPTLKAFFSS